MILARFTEYGNRYKSLPIKKDRIFGRDKDDSYINEWGIHVKVFGNYPQWISHPLENATIDDIQKYNWPNAENPKRHEGLKEHAEHLYKTTDFALVANPISGGIFEMAQHLRGLETFFIDLMINKDFANIILDKILEVEMKLTELFLECTSF